ncbi:MAG: PHP domain-containing protein [Ruminococcaceae bacterium]|nr:PHP domain-containing protein [Oscillospiraceae bacterium]
MAQNTQIFKVSPSVVEADKESEIVIKSFDGPLRFMDDITYEVQFIPMDESDVERDEELSLQGYNKARKTYTVKPQNGELHLKYTFKGEQEWRIHFRTKEYKKYQNPLYEKYAGHWGHLISYPERGISVSVYSLCSDLYERRAMIGDLHVHTMCSDGSESPELVAASYRKAGRDFIAITDHNLYNVSAKAKDMLSFAKNFTLLHGEEVHNGYVGLFHMVNIGGSYSVNDIYINEPERIKREVSALEKEVEVPEGLDKIEYLNRVWLYREIKKSGGYAIYPHPYWNIGYYHTSTAMSRAILKNGLCDAFEVMGGNPPKNNNLQLALWTDMLSDGVKLPIVGSTDSHSALFGGHLTQSTVAFVKDNDIITSISDGYSVAVESVKNENVRVYGSLRLVMYTHFLLDNYYPTHNELCFTSGMLMCDYVHGNTSLREQIEIAESRVTEYEKEFFGDRQ